MQNFAATPAHHDSTSSSTRNLSKTWRKPVRSRLFTIANTVANMAENVQERVSKSLGTQGKRRIAGYGKETLNRLFFSCPAKRGRMSTIVLAARLRASFADAALQIVPRP